MKKEKTRKDIFLRNCKPEDFVMLEKIAMENNCPISRAFDMVMDWYRQSGDTVQKGTRVIKKK